MSTLTERLRAALKLLKPLARRAHRDHFGAVVMPGSEDANPFAAKLEHAVRSDRGHCRRTQWGRVASFKTYDTEAPLPTLTTDFRGWNPPKKEPDHG